jgi:hypothetical protein
MEMELEHITRKMRLLRIRIHWLEVWIEEIRPLLKNVRQSKEVSIGKDNYDRLIKPAEVYEASNLIQNRLDTIREAIQSKAGGGVSTSSWEFGFYEILGFWYASTLWMCGASWQDLLAIRRSNHKKEKEKKRHLTWAEIARVKYSREQTKQNKRMKERT